MAITVGGNQIAAGLRAAADYDNSVAPAEGQAVLWVTSSGKWAPRSVALASHAHDYAATNHAHGATDVSSGVFDQARIPNVTSAPISVTYAASITINASLGNNHKITATGPLTLMSPVNPTDTQMLMVSVLASVTSRVVTIDSGIQRTTGLAGTVTITSGKVGFFGLRYSALSGNWTLLAQTTEL